MSLQSRLTVVYLLLLLPALMLLCVAVYFISRDRVYGAVDANLEAKSQAIEAALEHLAGPVNAADIRLSRGGLDRQALEGSIFQVRTPDGTVLYSSSGPTLQLPGSDAPPAVSGFDSVRVLGERTRVFTETVVRLGSPSAVIEVREPLLVADRSLAELRNVLSAGAAAIVLLTAAPAYIVAGRATAPVRLVSRLAEEIERTADFTRRLPLTGTSGEMRELAATFNAMIDRVERMMDAQRAFLADSSHELRRPLTILRTNIDIINDPRLSEEERLAIEEEMRVEAEAMSRLVSDLLLLAREGRQTVHVEHVHLSDLVGRSAEAARSVHRHHRFIVELAPDVWIEGDAGRLSQAVGNLVQNACTYTPIPGRISVTLRQQGSSAVVEVADNGVGMSDEDLAHAFDRFYRGSSAQATRAEGFGLGLAIVKFIVEAHGGAIAVESRLGRGTTFRMSLPLSSRGLLPGNLGVTPAQRR